MKKIGLIGGISWVSTVDYYRYINEGINQQSGGLQFAECIIYSLNFGEVQEKTWEHSFDLFVQAAETLKTAGVSALVLCANTAHLFADALELRTGLPIIHIVTETARTINRQGLKKLGLLGTKFTMEMDFYRKKLEAAGLEILVPEEQDTRDYIQYTLKEELGRGLVNPVTKETYLQIIQSLINRGAEGIIAGCTEIPLLLNQDDLTIPLFDTTAIHSQAVVTYMLSD
ncbi:MAG: amino acid racemase [Chitinophagaceae bacterium]|nr:MAG: amino acid racemase [Chitinophagaceae bacterium]